MRTKVIPTKMTALSKVFCKIFLSPNLTGVDNFILLSSFNQKTDQGWLISLQIHSTKIIIVYLHINGLKMILEPGSFQENDPS